MPDNILRVGAEFDVAPIVEGTQKAVAAFDSMATKSVQAAGEIKTAFASAAAADAAVVSEVQAATQETLQGFVKVKTGGILAFDALRAKVIESTAEVGRLRSEILQTDDQAKLTKLKAQLAEATAEMTAARTEMRALRFESAETTEKLNLMGESVGVKIPGGLGQLLGRLPILQTAMSAAFSVAVVGIFVDALLELPDVIGKVVDKFADWDEQAKKTYEDQIKINREAITQAVELAGKKRELSTIGIEGARKEAIEQENLKAHLADLAKEATDAQRALVEHQAQLKKLKGPELDEEKLGSRAGEARIGQEIINWATRAKEKIKEEEKAIADLRAEIQRVNAEQLNLKDVALPKLTKTGAKEDFEKEIRDESAAFDARKKMAEVYVDYRLASVKRGYELGKTTLDAEVAAERTAVEEKLQAERRYAAERIATLGKHKPQPAET